MTYNSIYISKDGKLLAMNKPEKKNFQQSGNDIAEEIKTYNLALQSSISAAEKEGIEFKDRFDVLSLFVAFGDNDVIWVEQNKGKWFSLPSGLEIRVRFELKDGGGWKEISEQHYEKSLVAYTRKFALLVRQEKELNFKLTGRDWTEDFSHENGKYMSICCECKNSFYGHKRRVICKPCQEGAPKEEPKEEKTSLVSDSIVDKEKAKFWYKMGAGDALSGLGTFEQAWQKTKDVMTSTTNKG